MVPAVMTPGRSIIPSAGDQSVGLGRSEVWRSRRLLRAILLGNLAFDFALVYAVLGWLS
jgi:hypothetical protein